MHTPFPIYLYFVKMVFYNVMYVSMYSMCFMHICMYVRESFINFYMLSYLLLGDK